MYYFDYAASTPLYTEVLATLQQSLINDFANPSSKHLLGHELTEKIEIFRRQFLESLNAASDDHFYFTSSATESNNTVLQGLTLNEGDTIIYSKSDHPSMVEPIEFIAAEKKCVLKEIPLNSDGTINLEEFSILLDASVKLVALTHVNNQSGVIFDILLLSNLIKVKSKAFIHVDAVQSFGKIAVSLNSAIDSLSFSAHKLGGPKGIAGLFLKKNHALRPLLLGGGQEQGFRSGTEAFPLIAAFHQAMKISTANIELEYKITAEFKNKIKEALLTAIPEMLVPFNNTSPYIFSFIIPGISSDILLRHLEMKEVYISSTSACSSKIVGTNPSLSALLIPEHLHKNFLRISFSQMTNEQEVEMLIQEFKKVWSSLKHLKGK